MTYPLASQSAIKRSREFVRALAPLIYERKTSHTQALTSLPRLVTNYLAGCVCVVRFVFSVRFEVMLFAWRRFVSNVTACALHKPPCDIQGCAL